MSAPQLMLQFIATRDHKLMRKVNQWYAPRWVRLLALAATRAGDGWLWYLAGILVAILGGDSKLLALGCAASAAAVGVGLFSSLKRLSGRKRPSEYAPHCWANLLPPDRFSFPSGHTITAFAVAISLGFYYPLSLIVLLPFAVMIGASRILLGMHFLSDVLVGATLGVGLAFTSYALFT